MNDHLRTQEEADAALAADLARVRAAGGRAHLDSYLRAVALLSLAALAEAERRPVATAEPQEPVRGAAVAAGRNEACPCGSGRKFKRCCRE